MLIILSKSRKDFESELLSNMNCLRLTFLCAGSGAWNWLIHHRKTKVFGRNTKNTQRKRVWLWVWILHLILCKYLPFSLCEWHIIAVCFGSPSSRSKARLHFCYFRIWHDDIEEQWKIWSRGSITHVRLYSFLSLSWIEWPKNAWNSVEKVMNMFFPLLITKAIEWYRMSKDNEINLFHWWWRDG